jgi:hypothetical protein
MFQRHAGIVEGRGAGADHDDALACQRGEVDGIGRVRVAVARQAPRDDLRHRPGPGAVHAVREHDMAREQRAARTAPVLGLQRQHAGIARHDRRHAPPVVHAQFDPRRQPGQVVLPIVARDALQRGPGGLAVARLEPGADGKRREAEFRPRDVLRRAQRVHAREAAPDPFLPRWRRIQDLDGADRLQAQREAGRDAVLAGADDGDVLHGALGPLRRAHPGARRVGEGRQFPARPLLQRRKAERLVGQRRQAMRRQGVHAPRRAAPAACGPPAAGGSLCA